MPLVSKQQLINFTRYDNIVLMPIKFSYLRAKIDKKLTKKIYIALAEELKKSWINILLKANFPFRKQIFKGSKVYSV